jgi:hypothetical protein
MEHVGVVVDDLAAATEFLVEVGLVLQGEFSVEGRWVDRIVGLEGVPTQAPVEASQPELRRLAGSRTAAG